LHATADTTFGSYSYAYDNNGNLTQKVDPNGNTINYAYDDVNRLLTEKLGSTTKVTYTYDASTGCTNGIGRLCKVVTPSETTNYAYNALGMIASQISKIGTPIYETDILTIAKDIS